MVPGDSKKAKKHAKTDSLNQFEAFYQPGQVIGTEQGYGGSIIDNWRLFYSLREPVGYWWIVNVSNDIWDNWFKVKSVEKPDDPALDNDVQRWLTRLKAKVQLPRETIFERRYGTAILLLSYTGFDVSWEKPLFTPGIDGSYPDLTGGEALLQITPYPWTAVSNVLIDTKKSSLRRGLPEFYEISIGGGSDDVVVPQGQKDPDTIKVHWTRVIHDAPRLDEDNYLGIPAIDVLFDDLVGGRNSRWGMYQGYYRNGQGFPVFKTKGTKKQNEDWVNAGGVDQTLNARGYFVCGPEEDVTFVGSLGSALNPTTYFDTYFTFIAAATNVAADTIKGVTAGRVSGSETNERKYYKVITSLQKQKDQLLRELIDRLMQSGQVKFRGDYFIDWIDPFEVNPQDKASIEFLQERTNSLRLQTEYIDEVRERKGMKPLPNGEGERLLMMPGQGGIQEQGGPPNQEEPSRQPTEPEEPTGGGEEETELLDQLVRK